MPLCFYLQHNMWQGYAVDSCRTTFALRPEIAKWSVVSSAEMESDGEFTPVMTHYFLCIRWLYNVCMCLCCCPHLSHAL